MAGSDELTDQAGATRLGIFWTEFLANDRVKPFTRSGFVLPKSAAYYPPRIAPAQRQIPWLLVAEGIQRLDVTFAPAMSRPETPIRPSCSRGREKEITGSRSMFRGPGEVSRVLSHNLITTFLRKCRAFARQRGEGRFPHGAAQHNRTPLHDVKIIIRAQWECGGAPRRLYRPHHCRGTSQRDRCV